MNTDNTVLTEEQKAAIFDSLSEINLDDFTEFFEMIVTSQDIRQDIPFALSFVKAIRDKVEIQVRMSMLGLQNLGLQRINSGNYMDDGGLIKLSWQ